MTKRFVGFARVSSEVQRREGYSLEAQEDRLRAYVSGLGGELVQVWKVAETASKAKLRSEFESVLAFSADPRNRIAGVVFDRVDRATRNPVDLGKIAALVETHGVHCHFVSEQLTTKDDGWFMVMIHGAVAYQAVAQLKSKVIAAQEKRVQAGLFHSKAPYGYENFRQNGRSLIRVVPEKAKVVRDIFDWYAHRGCTLDDIVRRLQQDGVAFSSARPEFHRASVYNILINRSYIGDIPFKGAWHPGTHPPLVDRSTFERVQSLLTPGRKIHHNHLFGDRLLRCALCEHPVTGAIASKYRGTPRESEFVYYSCAHCRRAGREVKPVKQGALEEQVLATFRRMRMDEEVRGWFRDLIRETTKLECQAAKDHLAALRAQLTKLEAKDRGLTDLRLAEEIDAEEFAQRRTELRDEQGRVREAIDVAARGSAEAGDLAVRVFELSQSLENRWNLADISEKRQLLQILCLNLRLDGATLCLEMRKPFDSLVEGPLVSSGRTGATVCEQFLLGIVGMDSCILRLVAA